MITDHGTDLVRMVSQAAIARSRPADTVGELVAAISR